MTPTSVAPGTSPDAAVSQQHHGPDDRAERTLRVCVIGKYPPIQGGISAQCYWMCRWLAERGHEVDVVTNADEVEDHYRLRLDGNGLADGDMRGSLRVWRTESPTLAYRHIPQTNPVVTKLTSLALEAIDRHGAELVVGFYLEPYAVAAYLAATLSGRPLVIRHAGSDVGRLLSVPQLGRTYTAILKSASLVCARPAARARFLELGVPESRIAADPGWTLPRDRFHPGVEPLDVNAHLASLELSPINPVHPIVGLYGKMGAAKGTFDLLHALIRLKRDGLSFTLLAATHGSAEDEARFARTIAEGNLTDRVRQIPFLAHDRVPSFLRACSLVCVLERGFPIAAHSPGTPTEVLACGIPLVVSAEIARKQAFAPRLVHRRNVFIVRDPRDHDELTFVLGEALGVTPEHRSALQALGVRGERVVAETISPAERVRPYEELFAAAIDDTHATALQSPVDLPRREYHDEEERCWAALQEPHPALACTEVLDALFYRTLDASELDSTSIPVLAPNVIIRPFSGRMDADGDLAPCAYAFQHLPFRQRTRIVRLGWGPYQLATLVDGRRSLGAIAAAIDPADDGLVQRVRAAAHDLFDEGVLVFSNRKERTHGSQAILEAGV